MLRGVVFAIWLNRRVGEKEERNKQQKTVAEVKKKREVAQKMANAETDVHVGVGLKYPNTKREVKEGRGEFATIEKKKKKDYRHRRRDRRYK